MAKTIVEKIVEQITADIFTGRYAPGDRLPPYRKLAESFDVTLPTAQRAVGRVHELGLLSIRQGSGATVLDPTTHATPGALGYWVNAVRDEPVRAREVVEDFLEVRRGLAGALLSRLLGVDPGEFDDVDDAIDDFAAKVGASHGAAELRDADLAVIRALLAVRPSIALATVFNSFVELLRAVPELTEAMYGNPSLNVVGYRGAVRLIRSGVDAASLRDSVETTMKPLDDATARTFERLLQESK